MNFSRSIAVSYLCLWKIFRKMDKPSFENLRTIQLDEGSRALRQMPCRRIGLPFSQIFTKCLDLSKSFSKFARWDDAIPRLHFGKKKASCLFLPFENLRNFQLNDMQEKSRAASALRAWAVFSFLHIGYSQDLQMTKRGRAVRAFVVLYPSPHRTAWRQPKKLCFQKN